MVRMFRNNGSSIYRHNIIAIMHVGIVVLVNTNSKLMSHFFILSYPLHLNAIIL